MKRAIVTTSIIVTFLGLVLTASPYLLKLFGVDNTVKNYILAEIIDDSQGKLDVQNFQIGFGKLTLRDVSLRPANQKFLLSLTAIEFSFNFWEIFSRPGHPEHAIEAIYLKEPYLLLSSSDTDSSLVNTISGDEIRKIFDNINKISTIENIQISEGKIIWKNAANVTIPVVDGLNGAISTNDPEKLNLEAKGKILSSPNEVFFINSFFDFRKNYVDATVLINDYEITEELAPLLPADLTLQSGMVNATLSFTSSDFNSDSTSINGKIILDHLSLSYDEQEFTGMKYSLVIDNNKLSTESGRGEFNHAPFDLSIAISNLFTPQPEIYAEIAGLKLIDLKKYLHTSILDRAVLDSKFQINWLDSIPVATVELFANRLELSENETVDQFHASFSANKNQITIESMSGVINSFDFTGVGGFQFRTGLLNLHLESDHTFSDHLIFDRLNDKKLDFGFDLIIDTKDGTAGGNWDYCIAGEEDTVISASGRIRGENNTLTVALVQSYPNDFSAQAEITNYLDLPEIAGIRFVNFPLTNFTSNKILKTPLDRYNSNIHLSGNLGRLYGNIDFIDKKNYKNHFNLNTDIENLFTPQRQISGKIKLKNLNGNYNFLQTEDYLEGSFDFSNAIHGALVINLKNQDQILSRIDFNHFRIFDLISDSTFANRIEDLAEINGKVHISGSTSNPTVEADLYADKIVVNNVGYFQSEFHLKMLGQDILSDSLVIYLNNLPILNGSLNYISENQTITGQLSGTDIDIEPLIASVLPDNPILKGTGSYDLDISGGISQPVLSGNVRISDGVINDQEFDYLSVNITDSIKTNGLIYHLNDHILKFSDLEFLKTGKINLTASGAIPLNATDPISVKAEFVGDILHFIPKLNSFFVDATSISEVAFELDGSPGRIRFKSGYVDIERGELWLDKVAPYIRNISGRIELEEGTNQVDFKNFIAWVDDERLTVNTVRDIRLASGEKLENWYFKGWDLDFGILQLETTERGVKINIPGLMEETDFAQVQLAGMEGEPHFYFAGPTRNPRLRGVVTLFNTRFTYPFTGESATPGTKPSVVVEFLQNLHWDILAHSGEDVVYYRDIPAYFDKVYTEVYIDETSPGIHFDGIINKGTFQPMGKAFSSRGRLEYLDQNFRVERFAVEFTQNDVFPYVSGRAWTTIRDSVGAIPKTIYLQLYAIDPDTKEEKQQGSWEDFKFKLVSQDPQIGETQEQVLAYLGFSVGNIREKATSVGGAVTERYLIRPLLRPIERALEKGLGVDLVRINSNIARNLFYSSVGSEYQNRPLINPFATNTPYLFLMQSSELTVGKYLSQNLYLTYTGQLVSIYDQAENSFDLNHSFGLEYRFLRNVLLELEYDRELLGYYRIPNQKEYLEDFKIRLRHSFAF